MKKLSIILLALAFVLSAGVAIAGEFYTAPNSTAMQAFPTGSGYPTINSISWTAGAATVDVLVLGGDNSTTVSAVGKAASATTFALTSCTGIDDDDYVVIEQDRTVGSRTLEVGQASACDDTTNIVTLAAGTANAFNGTNGFTFYEMKTITTLADIGTTKITYTTGPLWGGKRDWPMAVVLNGTGGTVHWLSGEWR